MKPRYKICWYWVNGGVKSYLTSTKTLDDYLSEKALRPKSSYELGLPSFKMFEV